MPTSVRRHLVLAALCLTGLSCTTPSTPVPDRVAALASRPHQLALHDRWALLGDSAWCGPDLLTWPLDAWRVANGVLTGTASPEAPAVAALGTFRIVDPTAPFSALLELALPADADRGLAGLALGLPDPLQHAGSPLAPEHPFLFAGLTAHGALVLALVEDAAQLDTLADQQPAVALPTPGPVTLRLHGRRSGSTVTVVLSAVDSAGREVARTALWQLAPAIITGHPALLVYGFTVPVQWRQARVSAEAAADLADQAAGPLLGAWFRHDGAALDMTLQGVPLAPLDVPDAVLEWFRDGHWEQAATGTFDAVSARFRFRIASLPGTTDWPYRVRLPLRNANGQTETFYWSGTVPSGPTPGSPVRIAVAPPPDPSTVAAIQPHLLAWPAADGPLLPPGAPFDATVRQRIMTWREVLRDRPAVGIETNATRFAWVLVGLLPDAETALDADTDWADWRGVHHVLRLSPDGFDRAARDLVEGRADARFQGVAAPDDDDAAQRALAGAGAGIGLVTLETASGRVELTRLLPGRGPDQPSRVIDGWPLVHHPWPAAMPAVFGHLPPVRVTGLPTPVVQVIDADDDSLVYSFRAEHPVILPRIPRPGRYRLRIGEPGTLHERTYDTLTPLGPDTGIPDPVLLVFDTAPPTEETP